MESGGRIRSTAPCPACHGEATREIRRQPVDGAAEHFVPRARDPHRHEALVSHLETLWGGQEAVIAVCDGCGFGFADPFVGGDERFYELAHDTDPHYPVDRWEFGQTLEALRSLPGCRLLEVGAGKGAFLEKLPTGYEVTAADFDHGAVEAMAAKGIDAQVGSLTDMTEQGPFDVVCMFQTLEHMADLDSVFSTLRSALTPSGSAFVSVPNSDATRLQEELTGFLDMPPNHVGRWTANAFDHVASRNGLVVTEQRTPKVSVPSQGWLLARYRVNARGAKAGTLAHRVQAMRYRPLRGVLKGALSALTLPSILASSRRFVAPSRWVHLQRPSPDRLSSRVM